VETKQVIAERWLVRILRTYPSQSARYFAELPDPFRNPVGHTYKESAAVLVDELLGDMNAARVTTALGRIIEIRAVHNLAPRSAVEFVFELKEILGEERAGPMLALYLSRVDEMALMAFELYVQCRERLWEARANEARRNVYVLERAFAPRPEVDEPGRGKT
jgi:hypothetical protein